MEDLQTGLCLLGSIWVEVDLVTAVTAVTATKTIPAMPRRQLHPTAG
jgi:hypothetical protein